MKIIKNKTWNEINQRVDKLETMLASTLVEKHTLETNLNIQKKINFEQNEENLKLRKEIEELRAPKKVERKPRTKKETK